MPAISGEMVKRFKEIMKAQKDQLEREILLEGHAKLEPIILPSYPRNEDSKEVEEIKVAKPRATTRRVSTTPRENAAMATNIAAATRAAEEIKAAVTAYDAEPPRYVALTEPMWADFTTLTKTGWRKLKLTVGHELVWEGAVRASARGDLLFGFIPAMNSELESREATLVEIAKADLSEMIGGEFEGWLSEQLGVANLEELMEQARKAVDPEEVAAAARAAEQAAKDEAERKEEEKKKKAQEKLEADPHWGSWA